MRLATLEALFRALNEAGARYLVVGGVAVNAHGYQRLTQDLDVVIELASDNLRSAFGALGRLGYRPALPVSADDFADIETRQRWIRERNLQVFSLISDQHPDTTVDLFVSEPFDFESEFEAAMIADIANGVKVRFLGLPALITMKEQAGRPRDLDDAEHLRAILREAGENDEH